MSPQPERSSPPRRGADRHLQHRLLRGVLPRGGGAGLALRHMALGEGGPPAPGSGPLSAAAKPSGDAPGRLPARLHLDRLGEPPRPAVLQQPRFPRRRLDLLLRTRSRIVSRGAPVLRSAPTGYDFFTVAEYGAIPWVCFTAATSFCGFVCFGS